MYPKICPYRQAINTYLKAVCKDGSKKTPENEITAPIVAPSSPQSLATWDALSIQFARFPCLNHEPRKVRPKTIIAVGRSSIDRKKFSDLRLYPESHFQLL